MALSARVRRLLKASSLQDRAMAKVYLRGDAIMRYWLLAHTLMGLGLAFGYQTWNVTLPAILCADLLFFGTAWLFPGQLITRIMAGIALQMFVVLHIYQMHGLAEMHFFFFTSTTAMVVYQDRRSILPGVVLIILQHITFAVLHNQGWQVFFFEDSNVGYAKLFFHFTIAFAQAMLCSVFAARLGQQTLADAAARGRLVEKNLELFDSRAIVSKELTRKSAELAQARELQQSIIPSNRLLLDGWELEARMQTCQEVGGDYFDYKVLAPGHVIVAVGDATGHGMQAAIVVAAAKAVFQRMAGQASLAGVFREVSLGLQGLGLKGTYMGLILLELTPGKVRIVASGMPPVLVKRAGGIVERLTGPGPFIGFLAETTSYPEAEARLTPGDNLLAFSDGLSERFDAQQKMLGWEQISTRFRQLAGTDLGADIEDLMAEGNHWQGTPDLPDDVTVVLAKALAPTPATTDQPLHLPLIQSEVVPVPRRA